MWAAALALRRCASEVGNAPYAGQQGVVVDATAWLVTAHR
jgi:hypothetical protein